MLPKACRSFNTLNFTHIHPHTSYTPTLPPSHPHKHTNTHHTYKYTHTRDRKEGKGEERMATGAAKMMLQCVFDGSISRYDMEIERRPYHRDCSCALHKLKGLFSNACSQQRNISFPKKNSWNDCSLSIPASKSSTQPSFLSNTSVRNKEDANGALSHRQYSFIGGSIW